MIIVTGATGNIGSELIRLLSDEGETVKAISRNPPDHENRSGINWVAADLADRESLPDIFDGADRLFLLTGNVDSMVPLQKNAIRAAEEAGISHVVKVSALGASDHSNSIIGVWHYIIEQYLRSADLAWTLLRPHVFMQNLLLQRSSIVKEGKVYSPSGDARIPMIDTRDIAAVSAAVLTGPDHEGHTYTLTGPEAISWNRATALLSELLNKSLTYVAESYDEAWIRLRKKDLSPWHIGAQLALADYQRKGSGTDIITDAVKQIAGRPANDFKRFAKDYVDAFRQL